MTTPENERRRRSYPYPYVVTAVLIIVVVTAAIALYGQFHHNYTETRAACYRAKFVLTETGQYENAKCTDPMTGVIYDPEYLGAPRP